LVFLFAKNAAGTSQPASALAIGLQDLRSPLRGSFRASVFLLGESYINGGSIAHEIGHSFGLSDALSIACVPASLTDATNSCGSWSNDAGDTMGSNSGYQHFSSAIKFSSFWLDSSQVQNVTASGEYTLDQLELPSSGAKALRIPLGKDSSGVDTYYWVEYRVPGIFDTDQGVQVRYKPSAFFNGSSMASNTLRFAGTASTGTGGGSISGKTVRESDGTAAGNVGIRLYDKNWSYLQYVYSDAEGRYAFRGLNAGDYYLQTYYNYEGLVNIYYRNSKKQSSATPIAVVAEKETSNIDFTLASGSIVSGTITRDTDGQPIPSATIYAEDESGNYAGGMTTDSSGRYYIDGLPAGKYFLRANYYGSSGYGYINKYYIDAKDRTTATPISLGSADKLGDIDFSLVPASAISGRVLSKADNSPIQNVSVYAYDSSWNSVAVSSTDSSGRYVIRGLPAGNFYVGTGNSLGYINRYYRDTTSRNDAVAVQVTAGSETAGIDLSLGTGSAISGRVLSKADNSPIQNVYVYAYDSSWSFMSGTSTDSSGGYKIRGLPAGSFYLRTSNSLGYVNVYYKDATSSNNATAIQVAAASETGGIDFSLVMGGAISGRVLSQSDNTPIQNVYVYAYDSSWSYVSGTLVDSSGRYIMRGLPPGNVYVRTYAQGYVTKYYKDTIDQFAATAIQVAAGFETSGIDFLLTKASPAPLESSQHPLSGDRQDRALRKEALARGSGFFPEVLDLSEGKVYPAETQFTGLPNTLPAPDVTSTTPFVDPYRGVKIEFLDSTGSGTGARARVKITLSKLLFDQAHFISFGQLPIQGREAKDLTITNQNATPVAVGTASIQGRNAGSFSISKDGCSGTSLAPGAGCKIEVSFSPVSYSGNTIGELAVLRIPNNDSLANAASVDLWGTVLAADLGIASHYVNSAFAVGQKSDIMIVLASRGTARFSGLARITEKLPAGLRFLSFSGSYGWACSAGGQDVNCTKMVDLPPGYGESVQLTVSVGSEAAPRCTIRATVSSESDSNPSNNISVISQSVSSGLAASYGASLLKEDGTYTGIALYNGGTATAALSMTALDPLGTALQLSGMTNPVGRVLKPGEQLVLLDSELWGLPDDQKSKMNWFSVSSSTQRVFGFEMAFDGNLKVLDGATLSRSPMNTAILPDIVTKDFTRVHIVNPNSSPIALTLDLITADGTVRAPAVRSLAPNGSLYVAVADLYPGIGTAESDYIRISGTGSFMATESMGVAGRWIKVLSAQDANAGAQVLYASQYVTGGDYWWSSISIVNLDSAAAQVSARLMDDSGKQIGQTLLLPIKANGKILLTAQNLFAQTGSTSGYVEIRSDSTRLAGSVTFGDQNQTVCAELPLQTAEYRELVFGQVASDSTWYTGIAVVNPNSTDVSATFQLLDKFGKVVDSSTQLIQAGQRKIGVVEQFFPKAAEAGVNSGYIRISGDNRLVGLALFGTANGEVLSAIPSYGIR
jgi:hypothetical protein